MMDVTVKSQPPVIDMWSPVVPSHEIVAHVRDNFPEEQLDYLRVFQKRQVTLDEWRAMAPLLARDDDAILASLDDAGIRVALISGFDESSTASACFVANEAVAAIATRHPERFIPFAGVDVMRDRAARETEEWISGRGFRGLSLRPFMIGLPATDRHYYPVFEKCAELQVPVSIHTSANWTSKRSSDLGHPRHLDQVACDFPSLRLIMSHGGYPWVLEACLVAWKHPNVYLELGADRKSVV